MHLGMPPGLAALVLQAQVVLTIVIAAFALREPPSAPQVPGVGLGALGLAVVALGIGGKVPLPALALCLLAGLSWGIGNVVSRAAKAPGGLALTVWSATAVPVPLLGLSLTVDGPSAVGDGLARPGWHGILSTAYTAGLCSLIGYAIFNSLLSRYPSGHVVPWVLLAPVVAMASSWALLGEVPGTAELAGAVLLVIGVLVAQGTIRFRGPGRLARAVTPVPEEPAPEELPRTAAAALSTWLRTSCRSVSGCRASSSGSTPRTARPGCRCEHCSPIPSGPSSTRPQWARSRAGRSPGALVRVADGVEGLVPAQELAVPLETLRSGDVVTGPVAGIDRERRRLTLSQRAASAGPR